MAEVTFRFNRAPTGELSGESLVEQTEQALSNLGQESSEAEEKADEAIRIANAASENADQAVTTATAAQSTANSALTTAQSAQTSANQAVQTAQSAVTTAQGASQTAQNAVSAASAAQTAAEDAADDAADSADIAGQALTDAQAAQAAASASQTAAESAQTSASQSAALATQAQSDAASSAQSAAEAAAAVSASARQIGEIISSALPLSSAGLHLLDGALIDGSGIYADFVSYIGSLYQNDPTAAYFTDETTWQSSVTTYGVCGKFVYDSVNDTVRLPKITGITEGTTDLTALGDLVQAGVPNLTGQIIPIMDSGGWIGMQSPSGVFGTGSAIFAKCAAAGNELSQNRVLTFNAANSNSLYGNSATVQPQTIKTLVYIVVATVTKTDIQVDIDEIATDLNGKADADLSNVPASKGILVESYCNGASWYRVYADGFCEQGAHNSDVGTVTLLKPFTDTNYNIVVGKYYGNDTDASVINIRTKTTSSFNVKRGWDGSGGGSANCDLDWVACGYIR